MIVDSSKPHIRKHHGHWFRYKGSNDYLNGKAFDFVIALNQKASQ